LPEGACHLGGLSTHRVGCVVEDLANIKAEPTCTVMEGSQPKHQVTSVFAVVCAQQPNQSPAQNAWRLLAQCGCCEIPDGPTFSHDPIQTEDISPNGLCEGVGVPEWPAAAASRDSEEEQAE
jgi:hypothetical protein